MSFRAEFEDALARTARLGCGDLGYTYDPKRKFDQTTLTQFPAVLRDGLGALGVEELVAQCISIHYRLQPVVAKWLECPVYLTFGWVDTGRPNGMFFVDETTITKMLAEPIAPGASANIHAWLTLPTMEIVDISLPTSFAYFQERPEMMGLAISRHHDDLVDMAYKPVVVGEVFARRAGLIW